MVGFFPEKRDIARYARHLYLEGWDQDVISSSCVLLVGVGALGCEIAKNLALVGVGELILIDMDTIEISNLSRQMLFTEKDKGRLKAEVAKESLRALNPGVNITTYTRKFQELPMEVFEKADVIAGGLDSFSARFTLNRISHELCIPYVDGAATGFKGNIQIIIPKGCNVLSKPTPCLRCFFPVPPADEKVYVACTIPGEPRSREQCILKAEDEYVKVHGIQMDYTKGQLEAIAQIAHELSEKSPHIETEEFVPEEVENVIKNKIPSILTVNAVISGIVSHEILKILHRLKERDIGEIMSPPYMEYSSFYGIFTPVEITRDKDCAVCSKKRVSLQINISGNSSYGEMLSRLREKGVDLGANALITKMIDGSVVVAPGQVNLDAPIKEMAIQNRDILRATYVLATKNGKSKRKQVEFIVEMGE